MKPYSSNAMLELGQVPQVLECGGELDSIKVKM